LKDRQGQDQVADPVGAGNKDMFKGHDHRRAFNHKISVYFPTKRSKQNPFYRENAETRGKPDNETNHENM
jgi:hypothetical protein